jgi:hypothetical protein
MCENLNKENSKIEIPQIPEGARLQFVRISGHRNVTDGDDRNFCVFQVEVRCNVALPTKWTVYRRYSQFRKLSDNMRHDGYYVPVMPPKGLLGALLPDFIRQREVSYKL